MKISTPLSAAALALSLVAVTGCDNPDGPATVDTSTDTPYGTTVDTHDHADGDHDHGGDTLDAAQGEADSMMQDAGDTADSMGEAGEGAMDAAGEQGQALLSGAGTQLKKVGDAAGEMAGDAQAKAEDLIEQAKSLVGEDKIDQAQEMLDQVKNMPGMDSLPASVKDGVQNVQSMIDDAQG